MDALITPQGAEIRASSTEPPKANLTTVSAYSFAKEIGEFIDEHLKGLVEFSSEVLVSRFSYIDVDVYYAARFFKELILAVNAADLIKAHFLSDDDYVGASISSSAIRTLTDGERDRLRRLAEGAGFDIRFAEGIVIKTKHRHKSFALIYAIGAPKIAKVFEFVIFDLHKSRFSIENDPLT